MDRRPKRERQTCDPDARCDCRDGSAPTARPTRRQFLATVSAATGGAAGLLSGLETLAGPFERENRYREVIPTDKKLAASWLQSLYARGEKETYTDPEALKKIGMPVGGLFAGTVYLAGDGRLWLWDVFNRDQEGVAPRPLEGTLPNAGSPLVAGMTRGGLNYLEPAPMDSPFQLGFSLNVNGKARSLDSDGFSNVRFDGRYPIGRVSYHDDACPVAVSLEAFSPFIPLNVDDSSLPATVMSYSLTNRSTETVKATISGRIENPVCRNSRGRVSGRLVNRVLRDAHLASIACTAEPQIEESPVNRPDIVFDDFERESYRGWTVEGEAFGKGPVRIEDVPEYQGDVRGHGKRVVNSHASASGSGIPEKDSRTGRLTSAEFQVQRRYVRFRIGGGGHAGKTCVNLIVDGEIVSTLTGRSDNRMRLAAFDTSRLEGRRAQLQIVDEVSGAWGNIGVDEIVFTDQRVVSEKLETQADFGSMALSLLSESSIELSATADRSIEAASETAQASIRDELVGEIRKTITLKPGEQVVVNWLIGWHFPNLTVRDMRSAVVGNYYAARFDSATEVVRYVATEYERLTRLTRKWVETWYDSTLPYWLLDRTMANTSTLATTTCYRFRDGRFWAWEGVGCCAGTCTHVWHYAQAAARLFPEIERGQRQQVDFGLAFHADGGVGHRAYLDRSAHPAVDGHCGRVLGVYREHLMSPDGTFLRAIWPRVRKAIEWLLAFDADRDGVLEGAQHNTLDAAWYGKIPWIISLYLATLRAGEAMAGFMGDEDFAKLCSKVAARGAEGILETWNGEYFVQLEDPAYKNAIGTGAGCHIDQVFGQTWSHWVGLGTLFDRDKQLSALRSLWKYNFVPDIGPFRERFPRGRWYAVEGDAGLLMCTWPKGGQNANYEKHWQYGYFNECMSGFEWQAAAHMVWEGHDQSDLLQYGLAISRAIHDRYSARYRNPYNEVECSDHYSRAMASYGVYQAVCGFECDGPNGRIGFAPRLTPEDFRAAFTAPQGWGTYEQKLEAGRIRVRLTVHSGRLMLRSLALTVPKAGLRALRATSDAIGISRVEQKAERFVLHTDRELAIAEGERVEVRVELAAS